MLTILSYSTKAGLHHSLTQLSESERAWKIVAPFPAKADALRTAWKKRTNTEVLTISKFTQDLFETKFGQGTNEAPWRKSRLLLLLNAFKNLHPLYRDVDFGTFKTAYQVYSDLRSYTDAPELPEELLGAFDVSVQELVKLFHFGTQRAQVRDEHAAVFDLIAELRLPEGLAVNGNPLLIFEGFTFITPAQLSFFEALAIRHDVVVPLPALVLERSHSWDWPQALKLAAHTVVSSEEDIVHAKGLVANFYPPGSLGTVLRHWRQPVLGSVQIILGIKTPSDGSLQEIPFADAFIKREVDVTREARDELWSRWEKQLAKLTKPLPASEILNWCQQEKKNCVAAKDMDAMRLFKAATMVEEAIQKVDGCLDNQILNIFLLRLLKEVVALDAPRNSLIPLLKEQATVRILGLRDVDSLSDVYPTALCLDSSLGSLKGDHRPYSPELEKELAKLGPVKRPELDFLFMQAELQELLDRPLTLFIEEGLLKHDLAWKQIFTGHTLEIHQWQASTLANPHPNYEFFAVPSGDAPVPSKMSASRLQDYLDCPRLYHAKRIEKIIPQIHTQLDVDAMVIGDLEHKLLAIAWAKGESWWSSLANLEGEALNLLKRSEITYDLRPVQLSALLGEVALYASNGLRQLAQVAQALPGTSFKFEVPLTAAGRTGFIDCLGSGGGATVLIDFKRAQGMNPGPAQWSEFHKIQLWFYLNALQLQGDLQEKVVAGYFFFKDPEASWLVCSHEEIYTSLEMVMGKSASVYPDWTTGLTLYQQFEQATMHRLQEERQFLPRPLSAKVCQYCDLQVLCPKSANEKEEA